MGMMEAGWQAALRRMFGEVPGKPAPPPGRRPCGPLRNGRSFSPLAIALEPRYLFDGAAAATVVDASHQADHPATPPQAPDPLAKALADHTLPADPTAGVSAPTQVRAADPSQTGGRKEVAFVDTSDPAYQALADGVRAGVEVELIDGGQSGLAQIAKWAESHEGYDAIHLISHGSEATLRLGTDSITNDSLGTAVEQVEMAEIGHALNPGGDLLLYGCDVAKGADGRQLAGGIATATGADVAASTDRTGAAALGGDWVLEYNTGTIGAPLALTDAAMAAYTRVLAPAHEAPTADALALIPDVSAPTQVQAADPSLNGGKREVVFIEDTLADYQTLVDGIHAGVEVELIDWSTSGFAQIAKWTQTHSGYDAIHVISHGGEGKLYLGTDALTDASLSDPVIQAELAQLGSALNAGGDLLVYGCDIAKGTDGQQFIADLAADTGANVAASTDATGNAALGGNWILESSTGAIDASLPFTDSALANYGDLLGLVNAGSTGTVTFGTLSSNSNVAGSTTSATGGQIISVSNDLSTGFDIYGKNNASGSSTSFTIRNMTGAGMTGGSGAYIRVIGNTISGVSYTPQYAELRANSGIFDLDSIKLGSSDTSGGPYNFTIQALDSSFNLKGTAVSLNGVAKSTFATLDVSSNTDFDGIYGFRITVSGGVSIAFDDIAVTNPRNVTANTAPSFVSPVGGTATLTVNQNAAATDIKGLLHVSDTDASQTETWTQGTAPSHGTLSFSNATATSGSADITPGGTITYTPTAGYSGNDTFTVQVSDGAGGTIIRTVNVTINPAAVNAAPILLDQSPAFTAEGRATASVVPSGVVGTLVSQLIARSGSVSNFTDTNSGDPAGMAITATDTTNGSWYYSTNNGSTWSAVSVDATHSLLLAADATTRLYFKNNGTFTGSIASAITFRAWDGSSGSAGTTTNITATDGTTAFSATTDVASLTINLENYAPTLADMAPVFTDQKVGDTGVPTGAVGTLVSQLINTSGVGNFSDTESATPGMAIIATDTTTGNGQWYYTINGGTNWYAVGGVTAANALMLKADANTRLYYVSNGSYIGTLSSAITFRAWDQTSGSAGSYADTSGTNSGGTKAFSTATDTASLTISANPNVAPAFVDTSATPTLTVAAGSGATSIASLLAVTDSDSGQVETWSQYTAPSHGTLKYNTTTLLGTTAATAASGAGITTPTFTYTPNAGYAGDDSFTVTVSDGQATITRTVTVHVTPGAPTGLTLQTASDSGNANATGYNSDRVTNATALKFSGGGAAYGSDTVNHSDGSDVIVFVDVNNNGVFDAATDRYTTVANTGTTASWSDGGAGIDVSGITGTYNVYAFDRSLIGSLTGALSSALSVTIDRSAPTLSSSTPANAATAVATSAHPTITFSDNVYKGSGNIVLHDVTTNTDVETYNVASSANITGWSAAGTTTLTITPTTALSGGDTYSIRIAGTAITDAAGNAYAGIANDTTLAFTTVNTVPVFAGGFTTLTVNENAGATDITSNLAVNDADPHQTETFTLLTGPNNGGTVTLTGATVAAGGSELALNSNAVKYTPANGFTGTETFTIRVSDGIDHVDRTFTVNVVASPNSYTENAAATAIDSDGKIAVATGQTWTGRTVSVAITNNAFSADTLALPTSNGGSIWFDTGTNTVKYNTTQIATGTAASATGSGALTFTLTAGATDTYVQALVQAFTFADTNQDPSAGARTVTFTIKDGSKTIASASRDLGFTLYNDPPTLTGLTAASPTFTQGDISGAQLFSAATASAVEAAQKLTQLTLTVSGIQDSGNEILTIDGTTYNLTASPSGNTTNGYGVVVTYNAGAATVTINTNSTNGVGTGIAASAFQSLITGITFKDSKGSVTTGNRVVTLTSLTDSGGATTDTHLFSGAASTVKVAAPPTATATGGNAAYTEQAAAAQIDSGIAVSSGNAWSGGSVTVAITANAFSADTLALPNSGAGIVVDTGTGKVYSDGPGKTNWIGTVSVNSGSVTGTTALTVILNGSGTITNTEVTALANAFTFADTNKDPTAATRTVTFTVKDGQQAQATATRGVAFTLVNDPPTLSVTTASPTFTQGSGTGVQLFTIATASAVEAAQKLTQLTLTVSGLHDAANEILTIDGNDVALTDLNSVTTSANGGHSYGVSVSVAGGTATVTIDTSGGGGAGASAFQSLITGIAYKDTKGSVTAGNRVVTLASLTDSGGATNSTLTSVASTVDVVVGNTAPVVSVPGTAQTITQSGAIAITGLSVTDDNFGGHTNSITADITVGAGTLNTNATTTGVTINSGAGSAHLVLWADTIGHLSTALGTLTYTYGSTTSGTDTVHVVVNDEDNTTPLTGSNDLSLTIAANAAPTATKTTNFADFTVSDLATNHALGGLTLADGDVGSGTMKLTLADTHGLLDVDISGTTTVSFVNSTATHSGSIQLTGSLADLNTVLGTLKYSVGQYYNGTDTITATIDDQQTTAIGNHQTASASITATVTHSDAAPTIAFATTSTVAVHDTVAVTLGATTGTMTVADTDALGTDVMTATVSDNAAGILHIDASGSGVTITSGAGNDQTAISFTGTMAQISAALSTMTYRTALSDSGTEAVTITVSDNNATSAAYASAPQTGTATINITGDKNYADASVSALTNQGYTDTNSHSISSVQVSGNSSNYASTVSVTVSDPAATAQLSVATGGGATITGNGTNSVTFTGTLGQVNTALAGLSYQTTASSGGTETVSLSAGYVNALGGTVTDTKTFTVTLTANGAPVLTVPTAALTVSNNSLNTVGTNGNAATFISVSDATPGSPVSVTVSDLHGTLAFTATDGDGGGPATVTPNGDNTSVVVSGSLADVNATLATLKYQTLAEHTGTETIKVTVDDGGTAAHLIGGSKTADGSFQISLTGNEAPVVTAPEDSLVVGDNHARTVSGFSFADISVGGTVSATISAVTGHLYFDPAVMATDNVTIDSGNNSTSVAIHASTTAALNAALASFTYAAYGDLVADTITVTVNDGNTTGVGGALTGSASLAVVTAPNDLPVFNSPADKTYYYTANNVIPTFSFTDTYYGDNVTATVSVNSGTVHLTASGGTVTANDTAQATITGTIAQVNAALNAMKYTTTLTSTATDTLTVSLDDNNFNGFGGDQVATKSITVTMIGNDTPALSVPGTQTIPDLSAHKIDVSLADTYNGNAVTVTLAVDKGTLNSTATSAASISGNGSKSLTLSGSVADINTILAGLRYTTTLNNPGTDAITLTVNDNGTDRVGGAKSSSASIPISVTYTPPPPPIAQAPVAEVKVSVLATTPTSSTTTTGSSSPLSVSTTGDAGVGSTSSNSISVGGTNTGANNSDGHRSITADSTGVGGTNTGASSAGNQVLSINNMGGVGGTSTGASGAGNQVLTISNMGGTSGGGSSASSAGFSGSSLGGGASFGASSSGAFSSSGSSFSGASSSFSAGTGTGGFNSGTGGFSTGPSGGLGGNTGGTGSPGGFNTGLSNGPGAPPVAPTGGTGSGGEAGLNTGSGAAIGSQTSGSSSGGTANTGIGGTNGGDTGTAGASRGGDTGGAGRNSSSGTGEGQGQDQPGQNRNQAPEQQNQNRNQTPEQQNQNQNRNQGPGQTRGQGQGGERGNNPGGEPGGTPGTGDGPAPDTGTPAPNLGPRTFLFDQSPMHNGPLSFSQQLAAANTFDQQCQQLDRAAAGLAFPGEQLAA